MATTAPWEAGTQKVWAAPEGLEYTVGSRHFYLQEKALPVPYRSPEPQPQAAEGNKLYPWLCDQQQRLD